MADIFDRAQELEEKQREQALLAQSHRARSAPKVVATGECHNPLCGEPLDEPGRLYCGPACAEEHGRRMR